MLSGNVPGMIGIYCCSMVMPPTGDVTPQVTDDGGITTAEGGQAAQGRNAAPGPRSFPQGSR
jgi:hypothetical protein